MSSNPNPGYLLYIGSCTTQLHIGNIINHCKDPYEPMSIMECQGFERCSLPKLCVNQPMSQPITYISYNITIAFNCYINQPITNNWYTNLIGWSFFHDSIFEEILDPLIRSVDFQAQKQRWLPGAVDGSKLCGMSEPRGLYTINQPGRVPFCSEKTYHTVDGSEIRLYNQLRLVVSPSIYRVFDIQTVVVCDFFHQQ